MNRFSSDIIGNNNSIILYTIPVEIENNFNRKTKKVYKITANNEKTVIDIVLNYCDNKTWNKIIKNKETSPFKSYFGIQLKEGSGIEDSVRMSILKKASSIVLLLEKEKRNNSRDEIINRIDYEIKRNEGMLNYLYKKKEILIQQRKNEILERLNSNFLGKYNKKLSW